MGTEAKHILLVDDEPDITYIVEFILSTSGFDVTRLNDSREVVKELSSGKYSMLILDLMMPHKDGFTVLKEMRVDEAFRKLPVLILSGRDLSNDETALLSSLGAEVMAKPFEAPRLLEKVRENISE